MSRSYDNSHRNQDKYGVVQDDWFDILCDNLENKVISGEITKEEKKKKIYEALGRITD